MSRKKIAVQARQRVRAARAAADTERQAREKRVDAAAEEYFVACGHREVADAEVEHVREDAAARIAKAEAQRAAAEEQITAAMDSALVKILDAENKVETVAELLGLSRSEVTEARKRHHARSTGTDELTADDPQPGGTTEPEQVAS